MYKYRNFKSIELSLEEEQFNPDHTSQSSDNDSINMIDEASDIENLIEATTDGVEAVVNLNQQIEENNELLQKSSKNITEDQVINSQETLYIALAKLNFHRSDIKKYRLSSENHTSPYNRLILSNENMKDVLSVIWEGIKTLFNKITYAIKNIFARIVIFFNRAASRAKQLIKGINDGKLLLDTSEENCKAYLKEVGFLGSAPANNTISIDIAKKIFDKLIGAATIALKNNQGINNQGINKQSISESIINIFKEVGLNKMIANIKEIKDTYDELNRNNNIIYFGTISPKSIVFYYIDNNNSICKTKILNYTHEEPYKKDIEDVQYGYNSEKNVLSDLKFYGSVATQFRTLQVMINSLRSTMIGVMHGAMKFSSFDKSIKKSSNENDGIDDIYSNIYIDEPALNTAPNKGDDGQIYSTIKLSLSLLNTVTNKIPLDIMMSIVRSTSASINAISKIVVPKT